MDSLRAAALYGAVLTVALLAASIAAHLLAGCSSDRPANVILISIDTLRADHIGAYGYARPTTPAIDRFTRDAVRFETCVAHAPSTLPSHASLLTSLLPEHHGASTQPPSKLSSQAVPVAELLRRSGYRTASFNGGIQLNRVYGLERGFEAYESVKERGATADALAGPENRFAAVVSRAVAWLGGSPEPFFLFLHTYEVHHPYTPEVRHLEALGSNYRGSLPRVISLALLKEINAGRRPLDAADLQYVIDAYDAEIRSADEAFGHLMQHLRERGLYDASMIVLTSDHGEEFGEHRRVGWHSHTLYDELLLVPLIVKLPGSLHAGRVIGGQVRGIDVAPTILDAAGLKPPPSYAGRSLLPAIVRGHAEERPALSQRFASAIRNDSALRLDRWKLYRGALYDLGSDPAESRNVAGRYPDRAQRLRALRRALLEERSAAPISSVEPEPDTVERLRALGYVE